MYWSDFKELSEERFKCIELEGNVYGYQIQPGTKWKVGLSDKEIAILEQRFGFEFPEEYKKFIGTMNGFDRDVIFIDPDGKDEDKFTQLYYEYPKHFNIQIDLLSDIEKYRSKIYEVLTDYGFDVNSLEGFVPTYGHRALVVFRDKALSPVVSIWGNDIVLLAKDLKQYWIVELKLEQSYGRI